VCRRPLDSIVDEILDNVEISVACPAEPCSESQMDGLEAYRVVLELKSTRNESCDDAMDQLLNGAFGLRARYAVDPSGGSEATHRVCRAIAERICANRIPFSAGSADSAFSLRANIDPSVLLPSAKIWFDQRVDRAAASAEEGSLECARWIRSWSEDLEKFQEILSSDSFRLTTHQIQQAVLKGRTVPTICSLDLKGAFTTSDAMEYVPLNKRTRALQLHLLGWS